MAEEAAAEAEDEEGAPVAEEEEGILPVAGKEVEEVEGGSFEPTLRGGNFSMHGVSASADADTPN